jgi:hypothetical protein
LVIIKIKTLKPLMIRDGTMMMVSKRRKRAWMECTMEATTAIQTTTPTTTTTTVVVVVVVSATAARAMVRWRIDTKKRGQEVSLILLTQHPPSQTLPRPAKL